MQAAFARPRHVNTWIRLGMRGVLTPRVGVAPEDDGPVLIRGVSQDLVKLHRESVQVANVQRAEVAMECIVEKGLVNAEVDRWERLGCCSRATLGARRPLGRRLVLLGIRERGGRVRRIGVRS
jgi:hypothetical protein